MKNLIVLLATLCLTGCASIPAANPIKQAPLATVAVIQCGKLVAMYVMLDANHMLRADVKQVTLYTIGRDGKVATQIRGPIDFPALMKLGDSAHIATAVETTCDESGIST